MHAGKPADLAKPRQHLVDQTLHAELEGTGVTVLAVCPGIVATEFQGLDSSAMPRMSAGDVVTAALAGVELGESVIAPGVENRALLGAVVEADIAASAGQSVQLARATGQGKAQGGD